MGICAKLSFPCCVLGTVSAFAGATIIYAARTSVKLKRFGKNPAQSPSSHCNIHGHHDDEMGMTSGHLSTQSSIPITNTNSLALVLLGFGINCLASPRCSVTTWKMSQDAFSPEIQLLRHLT